MLWTFLTFVVFLTRYKLPSDRNLFFSPSPAQVNPLTAPVPGGVAVTKVVLWGQWDFLLRHFRGRWLISNLNTDRLLVFFLCPLPCNIIMCFCFIINNHVSQKNTVLGQSFKRKKNEQMYNTTGFSTHIFNECIQMHPKINCTLCFDLQNLYLE